MLGKLLKYEIPALGRKLMPLYVGWLFTAVILGIALGQVNSKSEFFAVISILLYVAVATAVAVMSLVLIIQRFNNDLMGDGGYFSHSLPVTASQHILNKLIAAFLWIVVSAIALLITIVIIGGIAAGSDFFDFIDMMYKEFSDADGINVLSIVLFIIDAIFSEVKSILAIYTAITIGHQVRDKVILASIGAYIGLMIIETTIARILSPVLPGFNSLIYSYSYTLDAETGTSTLNVPDAFNTLMLSSLVLVALIGAIYFFLCKYFMEKKLNLA